MRKLFTAAVLVAMMSGCASWTEEEISLIGSSDGIMSVLTIDNQSDSLFLRQSSADLKKADLEGETYAVLSERMAKTLSDPELGGVGLAGPQVGILRRVVAVQRFDKEGDPIEVYPNVRIISFKGDKEPGPEGCLSVPDGFVQCLDGKRGMVERYHDIDIEYWSPAEGKMVVETVQGFTAVIFQHECDHLDGKLFIDYL